MPQDYYPQSDDTGEGNMPPEGAPAPKSNAETALMPKAMLGDVSPGQTVSVKVVRVYEDEVEVEKVDGEQPAGERSPNFAGEIKSLAGEGGE